MTEQQNLEEQQPEQPDTTNAIALLKRDIVDVISARVEQLTGEGALEMPPHYSPQNALMSAWLVLQEVEDRDGNAALEVCTKNSIANALMDMVIQGLSPAKQQCAFIVYGTKLTCQREYPGTMALLRRVYPGAMLYPQVVYDGDEFEYEVRGGKKYVTKHIQQIEHIDNAKITAAYVMRDLNNGDEPDVEIMTREQIQKSWEQGGAGGDSPAHRNFTDQMCMKTVINRACKLAINSSDDSYLKGAVQRQDVLNTETMLEAEMDDEANGEVIEVNIDDDAEPSEVAEIEVVENGNEGDQKKSAGPTF